MRDREGIVQVFFDPDQKVAFDKAYDLRNEFCIQIVGTVRARPDSQINKDMATGEVEVFAHALEIINRSEPLPLDSNRVNSEEARLKYRYGSASPGNGRASEDPRQNHQLRSPLHGQPRLPRYRNADADQGDAGRRPRLPVPSRVHKGKFYALP